MSLNAYDGSTVDVAIGPANNAFDFYRDRNQSMAELSLDQSELVEEDEEALQHSPESPIEGHIALSRQVTGFGELETIKQDLLSAIRNGVAGSVAPVFEKFKDVEEKPTVLACALVDACKDKDVPVVKALLELGADPNRYGRDEDLALVIAVELDSVELAECLLDNEFTKAETSIYKADGAHPLELVLSDAMATSLINHGASYEDRDQSGRTCLMRTTSEAMAQRFIRGGCDVNAKDDHGLTALLHSLRRRKTVGMFDLLIDAGADPMAQDGQGRSVWHFLAVSRAMDIGGNTESTAAELPLICTKLSTTGVNITSIDKHGMTPLHRAARFGQVDVLEILLDRGLGDVEHLNKLDRQGLTALHMAAGRGQYRMVELLLESGADPNAQLSSGPPCLVYSIRSWGPDPDVIKLLIKHNADVNQTDGTFYNALHAVCGCWNSTVDLVEAIFSKTSDVNATNTWGETALHRAAQCGSVATVNFLLANGSVEKLMPDHGGNLPMFYAATRKTNAKLVTEFFAAYHVASLCKGDRGLTSRLSVFRRKWTQNRALESTMEDTFTNSTYEGLPHDDIYKLWVENLDSPLQWTHISSRRPDIFRHLVCTLYLCRGANRGGCEQLQLLLNAVRDLPSSGRPQAIVDRNGALECMDVGALTAGDQLLITVANVAGCGSIVGNSGFHRLDEKDGIKHMERETELPKRGVLFICIVGHRHVISSSMRTSVDDLHMTGAGVKVPSAIKTNTQLAGWVAKSFGIPSMNLSWMSECTSRYEKRREEFSATFQLALTETPIGSAKGAMNAASNTLFDVSKESQLALALHQTSKDVELARKVISASKSFVDGMIETETVFWYDQPENMATLQAYAASMKNQLREIEEMQATGTETNKSLLVLMDLKQRQGNAIEAKSTREQSTLTRHQNQTLMVFTIVTVIFLPLSFIAAILAINITELPHDRDGHPEMPLQFVLRCVLGPGLGCAMLCVLIAFSGTLKRSFKSAFRRLFSISSRKKIQDEERSGLICKAKAV